MIRHLRRATRRPRHWWQRRFGEIVIEGGLIALVAIALALLIFGRQG
jgi:hypothetical protein